MSIDKNDFCQWSRYYWQNKYRELPTKKFLTEQLRLIEKDAPLHELANSSLEFLLTRRVV